MNTPINRQNRTMITDAIKDLRNGRITTVFEQWHLESIFAESYSDFLANNA